MRHWYRSCTFFSLSAYYMQNGITNIYTFVVIGMAGSLILCLAIILFYLRYQRRFYLQREQIRNNELNYKVQILHSTIQSQEDERKRIGRDLHDEVGGALANLRVALSKMESEKSLVHLNCISLTDSLMHTVRYISHNLSPSGLEIFGFGEVLSELCDRTSTTSGLSIILNNEAPDLPSLTDVNISIALYRVIQELLTNTIKHAEASEVTIKISCSDHCLIIDYSDNGKGIESINFQKKGIGMYNIESRLSMIHATFSIDKGKKGFKIHAEVPLTEKNKTDGHYQNSNSR